MESKYAWWYQQLIGTLVCLLIAVGTRVIKTYQKKDTRVIEM